MVLGRVEATGAKGAVGVEFGVEVEEAEVPGRETVVWEGEAGDVVMAGGEMVEMALVASARAGAVDRVMVGAVGLALGKVVAAGLAGPRGLVRMEVADVAVQRVGSTGLVALATAAGLVASVGETEQGARGWVATALEVLAWEGEAVQGEVAVVGRGLEKVAAVGMVAV